MAVVVPLQDAEAVLMMTNAAITAPDPARASMQPMAVMITPDEMPISSNDMPSATIPAFENAHAVQVITNSPLPSPEPSVRAVVVVLSPQGPV